MMSFKVKDVSSVILRGVGVLAIGGGLSSKQTGGIGFKSGMGDGGQFIFVVGVSGESWNMSLSV